MFYLFIFFYMNRNSCNMVERENVPSLPSGTVSLSSFVQSAIRSDSYEDHVDLRVKRSSNRRSSNKHKIAKLGKG